MGSRFNSGGMGGARDPHADQQRLINRRVSSRHDWLRFFGGSRALQNPFLTLRAVWGVLVPPMISVTLRKVCCLIAAVVGEVQGEVLRALQTKRGKS